VPGRVLFEACVDSVASAMAAEAGGADRVELCDNLVEGGTTPSAGMLTRCIERISIPVFVMIRPRGGDFLYDADEAAVMEQDIGVAAERGARGVVVGALGVDGTINRSLMARLIEQARPLSVTFHRAFDMTRDLHRSLATLLDLGIDRVLTSGAAHSALEGVETISALVEAAGDRLTVVAGGGVRPMNVAELVRRTGVREVHARLTHAATSAMQFQASVGVTMPDPPNEFERAMTSESAVRDMVGALRMLG